MKTKIKISYTKECGEDWEACVLDPSTGEYHIGQGKTKTLAKEDLVKWLKYFKISRLEQIQNLSREIACCIKLEDELFK